GHLRLGRLRRHHDRAHQPAFLGVVMTLTPAADHAPATTRWPACRWPPSSCAPPRTCSTCSGSSSPADQAIRSRLGRFIASRDPTTTTTRPSRPTSPCTRWPRPPTCYTPCPTAPEDPHEHRHHHTGHPPPGRPRRGGGRHHRRRLRRSDHVVPAPETAPPAPRHGRDRAHRQGPTLG